MVAPTSRRMVMLALAAVTLALPGHATATPHEYVQAGIGDVLLICDPLRAGLGLDLGGVCIPGGHIQPNFDGDAAIMVTDLLAPVSALYCQDLNANAICGDLESIVLAESDAENQQNLLRGPGDGAIDGLNRVEPHYHFCASAVLDSPLDSTPRPVWNTMNWDPTASVYVFVDGPVYGTPPWNPCLTLYSGGSLGVVTHT